MARPKKNYTSRELKEDRKYQCILYPNSDSYDCQLMLNRLPYFWQKYYYILHDKDVYLDTDFDEFVQKNNKEPEWKIGDLKPPHYHVVGYCNPILLGRAATKFGIPSNFVQACKTLKGAVQYLIHLNEPWKFQYSPEEIITNDENIERLLKKEQDSTEKAGYLFSAIFDSGISTMTDLVNFSLKNGCWDELRRGQHIFSCLLKEYNIYYRGDSNES